MYNVIQYPAMGNNNNNKKKPATHSLRQIVFYLFKIYKAFQRNFKINKRECRFHLSIYYLYWQDSLKVRNFVYYTKHI